ncbi:MAG: hypothetical protein U9O82_02395 [Thermodesulfobacteriota bacterium]|nr:hypothetical protein [Thermodesulfobacteriota bacterium]
MEKEDEENRVVLAPDNVKPSLSAAVDASSARVASNAITPGFEC